MSRKWPVNVKIAEREYPFMVEKEEDEERIRKAGRLINERLIQYKRRYSDRDVQDIIAYTAIQFAVKTIELETKASSTEQADRLKKLDDQLDIFLKQYADC
jgi:cell division protein ZapA